MITLIAAALAAASVPSAFAVPVVEGMDPPSERPEPVNNCKATVEYRNVEWGKKGTWKGQLLLASGYMCMNQGDNPTCTNSAGKSYAVTQGTSVNFGGSFGIDLGKILHAGLDAGMTISWSTTNSTTYGSSEQCPVKNAVCGLQGQPTMVTITGQAKQTWKDDPSGSTKVCGKRDKDWTDFKIDAPVTFNTTSPEGKGVVFSSCLANCIKPNSGGDLPSPPDFSCIGQAVAQNVRICPGMGTSKDLAAQEAALATPHLTATIKKKKKPDENGGRA